MASSPARPRRIALVTGTRADWGLLRWFAEEAQSDPRADLRIVACGMHLVKEFGHTVERIAEDGFEVAWEVDCLLSGDSGRAAAKSMAVATAGFADAFSGLGADVIVVLGDRFEALAAACAATFLRVPVVHIHGGEITEGAVDDACRHAISKLSHLHMVAARPYGQRLVQMGEDPARVHVVGTPGLENLLRLECPDREALLRSVSLDPARPFVLLTYHPVTLEADDGLAGLHALLDALAARPETQVLATKANADPGGRRVNAVLQQWVDARDGDACLVASLGQHRYTTALREARAVVGNSSSGIIEAPAVGTTTVNVGSRQAGRLRATSIIDCAPRTEAVSAALDAALDARAAASRVDQAPPYGLAARCSRVMLDHVLAADLDALLVKPFHDLQALESVA